MSENSGPKTIYIIRHGEKLGDPCADGDDGPDLSVCGSARATALPSLFAPAPSDLSCVLTAGSGAYTAQYQSYKMPLVAPPYSTPDFLFASAGPKPPPPHNDPSKKKSSHSNRPVETITALATALNQTINSNFADGDEEGLKNEITTKPEYVGKVVLICWHHGKIPALAEQFGITNASSWDCKVFDRIWEIPYNPGPPTLIDHPQQLLFGDSST